jgi:hypothetical protein
MGKALYSVTVKVQLFTLLHAVSHYVKLHRAAVKQEAAAAQQCTHCLFTSATTTAAATAASSANHVGVTKSSILDVGYCTVSGDAPTDNFSQLNIATVKSPSHMAVAVVVGLPRLLVCRSLPLL